MKRVLLVEDDEQLSRLLRQLLSKYYDVEILTSLAAVKESSAERMIVNRPHAVLLDLYLPDSRGVDTVLDVSRCLPGVPIVAMTGVLEVNAADVEEAGADVLLRKPVDTTKDSLLESLRLATTKRKVRDEFAEVELLCAEIYRDVTEVKEELKALKKT